MTPSPEPSARKRTPKSQSGCITCRYVARRQRGSVSRHEATSANTAVLTRPSIRRVKCDETRPACTRCTTTRRRCDGYLPPTVNLSRRRLADLVRQTPSLGPAAESLVPALRQSPEPLTQGLDSLLFDVFRHATAPGTASLLPSLFWTRDLLQMAHGESAIWHATLSLGALHRQWEAGRDHRSPVEVPAGDTFKREAHSHYFRAISLAKLITDAPTLRALSVVLVAVSNILGRWSDSRTHLFGGLRLLGRGDDATPDVDSTAEVLERLDLQAMTFSDSQAPYPFQSPVRLRSVHRRLEGADAISSYGQAGTLLFALLRQFILLSVREAGLDVSPISLSAGEDTLVADLATWEAKMQEFEGVLPGNDIPSLSIRLYHAQLRLWIEATLGGDEMRWDTEECLFYFDYIVSLAATLIHELNTRSIGPLSLEPAVIVPLFSTAHRCRHPYLRRKATTLLKECKRQEGMWSSDGAAAVVERLIAAEEGTATPEPGQQDVHRTPKSISLPHIPWDIWSSAPPLVARNVSWEGVDVLPDSRRVKDVIATVDYEKQKADITLLFPNPLDPEAIAATEDVVYF